MRCLTRFGAVLVALSAAGAAYGEEAAPAFNSGDTAFVAACALVVWLMTLPGLALFYGGMARRKNVLSILMQVFCIAALMALLFTLYGYTLIYSDGGAYQALIGGLGKLGLLGVGTDSLVGSLPEYLYFFFVMLFATITPGIIVGSFAERARFSAVLWFSAIWLTINYIPLAHMAWGGGWIAGTGDQDFAGGDVVHVNVGVASMVGAFLIGRRRGHGTAALMPHNMTMCMTGGSMLWVGWLGFCGGCAYGANGLAMLVMVNTLLAGCSGALAWAWVEWKHRGTASMLGAVSGAIAGLVAVTPACGYIGPLGAIALGALVAPLCLWAVEKLKPKIGADDAFDVFGVHGVGGIAGGLLTPLFACTWLGGQGIATAGRGLGGQLLVNAGVMLFCILYSAISSYLAFKAAGLICGGLRVDEEQEVEGLDITAHGEVGYRS